MKANMKAKKNKKRKLKDDCKKILDKVGTDLYDIFSAMCDHNPIQFLTIIMYRPQEFQNCYMAWKFASKLKPKEHIELDEIMSQYTNGLEALEHLIEWAIHHKKINSSDLFKNIHTKTLIEGGKKTSRISKQNILKAKQIAKSAHYIAEYLTPGKPGFNQNFSKQYSAQIQAIRNTKFSCHKDNGHWHLQPYQKSAIFLGSKSCLPVNRLLIIAPTGSGKTAIIQHIMASFNHDDRVKFFATPNENVQENFYSQIHEFHTSLATFLKKYSNINPKDLLMFNQNNTTKFVITKYRQHLQEARSKKMSYNQRQRNSKRLFGPDAWIPYSPLRSVLFKQLIRELVPCDNLDQFKELLKSNKPCVKRKNTSGSSKLTTFSRDYAYDTQAATTNNGLVMNPFNNRIIILDEVDQLFKHHDDIRFKMLIYMLKYATNTVLIGLTATPLIKGDSQYSDHTCRVLEMIKGKRSESDPLSSHVINTCSNEGFISYYNSMLPPLYPMTKPFIGNMQGKPVLGRIVFAQLHHDHKTEYQKQSKEIINQNPLHMLKLDNKIVNKFISYATSRYTDRFAKMERSYTKIVNNLDKLSNKSSCIFKTLMQDKRKTLVLFTHGMETFKTYIKQAHKDMYYDINNHDNHYKIAFIKHSTDSGTMALNKARLKAFNNSNNIHGEKICVMCADSSFFVGVNFKNVRRLILVTPPLNSTMYIQTVGRVLRMCTYDRLPQQERNVQIDIMVATLDPNRKLSDLTTTRFNELAQQHKDSKKPVLTIDEVLIYVLYQKIQSYRQRMDRIFAEPAIDKGWYNLPLPNDMDDAQEELEARCTAHGVESNEYQPERDITAIKKQEQDAYIHQKDSHIYGQRNNKGLGRQKANHDAKPVGIGVSKIKHHAERAKPLPKPLPVMDDREELRVAKKEFRNLSFPKITEAEFDVYKKFTQVPVQTFVYNGTKEVEDMIRTMSEYTNALVLVRDKYMEVQNFGESDNFHIEVLLASAAKRWKQLESFYNNNFTGQGMKPWTKVIGINLYYITYKDALKTKRKVYVQYEPDVKIVRPVLFTNLKAWMESTGDKTLTDVDYHKIYQSMPEFRKPENKVRFKEQQTKKINKDGSVDVMVDIKVPTLAGFNDEISAKEALSQPASYNRIVEIYSNILMNFLQVPMQQIKAHKDQSTHLVFHVYSVKQQVLEESNVESALNLHLLDPDPNQELLIPVKRMDGHTEDYVLKVRQNVTSSNIMDYVNYSVGAQLPKRKPQTTFYTKHEHFTKPHVSYPSSKEILNNNNGNIWIIVGSNNKFRIYATPTPLPTVPMVDPYRDQPMYQKAKNENKPFVLLNQIKNEPWQMAVTKPYASIRQFALHASDHEYDEFWKACVNVKERFESERGSTLYMYTDQDPSLAIFHVNFSIDRPAMPSRLPVVKPNTIPHTQTQQPTQQIQQITQLPSHVQTILPKTHHQKTNQKKVKFADKVLISMKKDTCAKQGDEIYLLAINIPNINLPKYKAMVLVEKIDGVYTLPHITWNKIQTKTYPLLNISTSIEYTEEEEVDKHIERLIKKLNLGSSNSRNASMDLSNQNTCVKIVVKQFSNINSTNLASNMELISLDKLFTLNKTSEVLKGVQTNMKSFVDTYINNL